MARTFLYALAIAAAGACASAAGGAAQTTAAAGAGPFAYVANQGEATVSVIDVSTLSEVARVDLQALGYGPDSKPHDTAVEPDGSAWYLTLIGGNRVLKFDRDNRLVGEVETEVPGLVEIHPGRDLLVAGRSLSAVNPPTSVAFIRRSDMTLLDDVEVVFPRPHALAVAAGDWAYVASLAENRLAAIELEREDVNLVDVPAPEAGAADSAGNPGPHTLVDFAVSPDGSTMVAGGQISGELLVFDLADGEVPTVTRRIHLGGSPWHPIFTPDGRWLYVPLKRADAVAVLDTSTWEVVKRIEGEGLAEPHGAAASADGRWVFVTSNNGQGTYTPKGDDPKAGTVVAIDTSTMEIAKVIEVGAVAAGVSIAQPAGGSD